VKGKIIMTEVKKLTRLSNDIEKIIFTESDIKNIVSRLAEEIEHDYTEAHEKGERLVVLALLNGSVQFMSDLVREIDLPLEFQFMFTSSYGQSTVSSGEVKIHMGKCESVLDDPRSHILIIEDIIDSGNTLSKVLSILKEKNNASVKICALFDKPERRTVDVHVDYIGACVPDEFIVGYGLDYDEQYRNLPYVGVLKRDVYEK
jgi:hypoxanthine phosphoribosyltransferase